MTQVAFSAGRLYVAPTGADTAVLQPTEAGELQGIDIDFGAGAHFLADAHGWAVATGRGRRSIRCSAEVARLSADFYAAAIAGRIQTGRARVVRDEPAVVTGGTVTAAQAGCDGNLGVIDAATGAVLVRADAPGPGQYATDDAGAWTFNAADEGRAVLVSYQRHDAAGFTLALGDRMGHTPRFSAVLSGEFEGQRIVLELFSCAVFAGSFGSKLGQFVIPGFTFAAMSPPDGIVGRLSLEGVAPTPRLDVGYITSWTYPLEAFEAVGSSAAMLSGLLFDMVIEPEQLASVADLTGGELATVLLSFDAGMDAIGSVADLTGGTIVDLLRLLTADTEAIDSTASITGGTLVVALVQNAADPEGINSSAAITGGTLE